MYTNDRERVVITGIGVIAPNGIGLDTFWKHVKHGNTGIKKYSWGAKDYGFKSRIYGNVESLVQPDLYQLNNSEYQSRYLDFVHNAAEMAICDSNIDLENINRERLGVVVASAVADAETMERYLIKAEKNNAIEDSYYSLDFGTAAASLSQKYGANACSVNLSTGCVAGIDALGMAMDEIRYGNTDVMIAGSCDVPLCPLSIGSFEALGALSTRDTTPSERASCPFSKERDGFVIAEGCGIFLLESYTHAKNRNANIYAEVAGYASINNAYHMTDLHEDGIDMAKCIELAMKDSACVKEEINYISAHGSSTRQNDINETAAIKLHFGEQAEKIPINSLKAMTGHSLSAANSLEIAALCKEIQEQYIYPTINYGEPDETCDLDYVVNEGRDYKINAALKLSSGFSGIHSVIVIKDV